MYPETDLPLLKIGREKTNEIRKIFPKMRHELRDELKKKGLSDELINLVLDGNLEEFETLIRVYEKDANLIAKMVVLWRNEFATKLKKSVEELKKILSEKVLERVLEELRDGNVTEGDVKKILESVASGEPIEKALKVERVSDDHMEEEISKLIKEKPGMRENAYMGMVMAKFKGKLDARKAMELIKRVIEKSG